MAYMDVSELVTEEFPIDEQRLDPYARKLFSQVFTGMNGRYTRMKIIKALVEEPSNVNQISKKLGYDYKSIQRNLKILQKNQLVESVGDRYGEMYFVSDLLMKNLKTLDGVLRGVDIKLNKKKTYL